ncbi:Microphthalmia-associated transcription factor [Lamellibrachia satsuma]|nr:Microphthalmia-associated transcription factor [Lamellibrachia satsuma]
MDVMKESGISLDFDAMLEGDDITDFEDKYYQLQSKPIELSSAQPEVKNVAVSMRTNLRQQLMKQQLAEQDKRFQQHQLHAESQVSDAVSMPNCDVSVSTEVPAQILQVKTCLLNPTKFHVKESQKRQIQLFLNHEMGKSAPSTAAVQSLPTLPLKASYLQLPIGQCGSAPTDPDSPRSAEMSSRTTSISEVDDLLGDIISLESVDMTLDNDLAVIEPSLTHISQTLPDSGPAENVFNPQNSTRSPSSCPAIGTEGGAYHGGRVREDKPPSYLGPNETRIWAKERVKKDNHNLIERRRRFNINDRIKELGTLLPKYTDPDLRQNKGSILKASVDYIRRLQRDQERLKVMEERQRQLETTNRKMLLHMQELEMMMKSHGITHPQLDSSSQLLSDVLSQPELGFLKTEESMVATMALEDEMLDESPVSGDPMLSTLNTAHLDYVSSQRNEDMMDLLKLNVS